MQQSMEIELWGVNLRSVRQTFFMRGMTSSIFSCKATTKSFIAPKIGKHLDVDVAVLHIMKETRAKGMPFTQHSMQVKATNAAKSLRINFKAG
jgi:hypothetical protein